MGSCTEISTQLAKLESKVIFFPRTLFCRFSVQLNSQVHLLILVSARSDWGFWGEDGMPPLGYRHACNSPYDALSTPATVVANSGGLGMCERFHLKSSQHTPHKCQFFQRTAPCRVGRTVPARMEREFYPYQRDRTGRCAS